MKGMGGGMGGGGGGGSFRGGSKGLFSEFKPRKKKKLKDKMLKYLEWR